MKGKRGAIASRVTLVIAIALAGVLLYLAFRGVDWAAMLHRLAQGQLDILALAFLTFTVSYCIRALRWRLLLSADRRIAPITVFWGIVVGYLGNNFLPARAGELIRSALLARKTGLSVSFVLATALVERVLDVVALVLIGFAAVATLAADVPAWLVAATRVMAVLAVAGLAVFVAIPRLERPLQRLLTRLLGERELTAKLSTLLTQFLLGMRAFQHRSRGAGFAALTVVIWLGDSLALILVARAFDLTLTLPEALLLIAALGLASAAPSTPGYVGIYQFVAVTVLAPFGFSRDAALAYIIAAQAVIYAVVIVWGALGLWALGFRRGEAASAVTHATEAAQESQ
jgi:glycosyltransferase 2 family protein